MVGVAIGLEMGVAPIVEALILENMLVTIKSRTHACV